MTNVVSSSSYGLTVWYDSTSLPPDGASSEAFCFAARPERDARAWLLRGLPSVRHVTTWDADPGYSLLTYYKP